MKRKVRVCGACINACVSVRCSGRNFSPKNWKKIANQIPHNKKNGNDSWSSANSQYKYFHQGWTCQLAPVEAAEPAARWRYDSGAATKASYTPCQFEQNDE